MLGMVILATAFSVFAYAVGYALGRDDGRWLERNGL